MVTDYIGGAIGLADDEPAISRPPFTFRFDYRNPDAIAAAERAAAMLVTRVSEEMRQALRALIVRGIREGVPPAKLARMITDAIGLNAQQAAALMNYRAALEAEEGLSPVTLERQVVKYRDQLLRKRKQMIARTETMRSVNSGKLESAMQAQSHGWLGSEAVKRWTAAPEELMPPRCEVCAALDGMELPLHAAFPLGRETAPSSSSSVTAVLAPPAHPHCRCTLKILPRSSTR